MRFESPRTTPRALAYLATALACALLASCDITNGGDPAATVVLAGQVVDTLGNAQQGVRVVGRGFRGASCGGEPVAYAAQTTGADGAYVLTLQALATAFTGCTELTVEGQAEPEVPLRALGVRFREGAAVDTLRTTIVYRPAPAGAAHSR